MDGLLAEVSERLAQLAADSDPGATREDLLREGARLAARLRPGAGEGSARDWEVVGLYHWHRLLDGHDESVEEDIMAAAHAFGHCLIAGVEVHQEMRPLAVEAVGNIAVEEYERVARRPELPAVDRVISLLELAASQDESDERFLWTANLSGVLEARYQLSGDHADIDRAVEAGRQAAAGNAEDSRAVALANTGVALLRRFEARGMLADLHEAVSADRAAVDAEVPGSPDQAKWLVNLGGALTARFEVLGQPDDLDAAIAAGDRALAQMPWTSPDRPGALSNLAIARRTRFDYGGESDVIDASVATARESLGQVPAGSQDRPALLANLGASLLKRFEHAGGQEDLDEAVTLAREAAGAMDGRPDWLAYVNDLVSALTKRFECTGRLDDLNEAVATARQATRGVPAGSRFRAQTAASLCAALWYRYTALGDLSDLNAAIAGGREVTAGGLLGGRSRAMALSAHGAALLARFEREHDPADLAAAITACREAADSLRGHDAVRGMALNNLCGALRARFAVSDDPADLDGAIAVGRQAVTVMPAGHQYRAACLASLCGALQAKAEWAGKRSRASLREAVSAGRRAVDALAAGHPVRALALINLGRALDLRFQQTGRPRFRAESVKAFSEAAGLVTAPVAPRLQAARSAATILAESEPDRAAGLLDAAVRLLPQVAPRLLGRQDQEHALSRFAGLANDAAALALGSSGADRAERALSLLELGRGVLYSQALDLDADVSALAGEHPALATRFRELRLYLDAPASPPFLAIPPEPADSAAARRGARRDRHQAAAEFDALLAEIRGFDQFADFLRPPSPRSLLGHAQDGPVVSLSVSRYRCDALAVTPDGISHIPLPGLDGDALAGQVARFSQAIEVMTRASAAAADKRAAEDVLSEVLEWLWDVAAAPVLTHRGLFAPWQGTAGGGPRVWWVPGGLLGRLPLHAAGYHRHSGGDTVMDHVVSSYTPTIRALAQARQRARASGPDSSLVVAMPTTPGQAPLPNAAVEAERLRALLPGPVLLVSQEPPAPDDWRPTKASVLRHLAGAGIAHFACHASADAAVPSGSRLYLEDWQEDPLTVASLSMVRLEQAQLAYLSACRTSFSAAADLLDEAIHLTSAFQLTGFPQVIGTFWEVSDWIAAEVAHSVYTGLRTDESLDTAQAARSLHRAVRDCRDQWPDAPSGWASYAHFGA